MYGFSGGWPRPFAVGVLALSDPDDEESRTAERLALAMEAYRFGYYRIDTVEVRRDGAGYEAAESLAARAGADAFVTRGPVDRGALGAAASRRRLVVHGGDPRPDVPAPR